MHAWTVLVYMAAAAADLAVPAERDLGAMASPGAGTDVAIQIEGAAGAERLHFAGAASETVDAFDDRDVPASESLRRFVSWGVGSYPSEHYAVVVWGHGLGWRPAKAEAGAGGGIVIDAARGAVLDVPGLAGALAGASQERLDGRPFDVYASDACLMESIEVAGELAGAVRFVVGSEQVEQDDLGLPYGAWLPVLDGSSPLPPTPACAPGDDACRAAAALPELGAGAMADRQTLSALDEEALTGLLLPSLRDVSAAVEAYVGEDDLRRIGLAVLLGPERGAMRGTPGFPGGTRDVGVFLDRLAEGVTREPGAAGTAGQKAVLDAVARAREALGRTVVAASFGARYRTPSHAAMAGLSVWLPHDAAELDARAGFFSTTALWRTPEGQTPFRAFLDRILAPP